MESTSRTADMREHDNTYHYAFKTENVAEIPTLGQLDPKVENKVKDTRVAFCNGEVYGDIRQLRQNTCLPDIVMFDLLAYHGFSVNVAIHVGKKYTVPNLVPEFVKDHYSANIIHTRQSLQANPKYEAFQKFYYADTFRKVVGTKSLVSMYYNEKNKIGGKWKPQNKDDGLSGEEWQELEKTLEAAKIEVIIDKYQTNKRSTKKKRSRRSCSKSSLAKENKDHWEGHAVLNSTDDEKSKEAAMPQVLLQSDTSNL